jgi:hypothetical protein
MQNIDIVNGKPFLDKNVKTKLTLLQKETPQFNTISYATWSNPSTTERTFVETTGNVAVDKLVYTVDCVSNITSNITGAQDFTFKLYLGSEVVATSVVSVPDALNTLFSVKLDGYITYTRTNSGQPEYVASLIATPMATDATASVSTITVVNKQFPAVTKETDLSSDLDVKLTATASVGTATTVITCLGGRALFDKN